ncbi:hypothetical protein OIDMADRAFT_20635 [Oidiodendron maius Zn]|uniref:Uncharacterized protein n=1 Tax=Oidiodendron maius (strain Zn) TaxID=913774 RepID=A0A0C3D440_OIDMZ|nr:hypothetical protein OIDMADRAFT_20635 [Oidiodendron maius Zn]
MAPISPQAISIPSWIIIGIVISIIGIVILLLTATTLWIIVEDIWYEVLKDYPRYLKREKLRKEWNKAALVEEERQFSAIYIIIGSIKRQGKLEEILSLLLELT